MFCGKDASTSMHNCSITSKHIMAWCETVVYGKGPCEGYSGKANLEEMGSDDSGISSNDIDETNKKTDDGNDDDLSNIS